MEERICKKVSELYQKFQHDEYVKQRLDNYICNILPVALSNAQKQNEQRKPRREQLAADADTFTERFLHKGNYYYCLFFLLW